MSMKSKTVEDHEVYVNDLVWYADHVYFITEFTDDSLDYVNLKPLGRMTPIVGVSRLPVSELVMVPCTFQGGSIIRPSIKVWAQLFLLYKVKTGRAGFYTPAHLEAALPYIDQLMECNHFQEPFLSWDDTDFEDMIDYNEPVILENLFPSNKHAAVALSDIFDHALSLPPRSEGSGVNRSHNQPSMLV